VNTTSALPQNIQAARNAWGWSQERMAKFLRVDQASISLWEKGKVVPSGVSQFAIACLFGVTVEEIHEPMTFTKPFTTTVPALLAVLQDEQQVKR
jgi:DNA-binding XRE family transcriptional regulator